MRKPLKIMPLVYSIIWFIREIRLTNKIIEKPKFMDFFGK